MKRIAIIVGLGLCLVLPSWMAAQEDHGEVGVFADYVRFAPTNSVTNFIGAGGRLGINVSPHVAIEGEMNYDFKRNFTTTTNSGISTNFVTTGVRPLTGLFGPKFQAGTTGPFRVFLTAKAGFINFSTSNSGAVTGGQFSNAVTGVGGGSGTHVAFYPGGGIEGFIGPVGLRLEVGDEVYLNNGTYNNLRVTFGPHIRF